MVLALAGCGLGADEHATTRAPAQPRQVAAALVTSDVTPPAISVSAAQGEARGPPFAVTWTVTDENATTVEAWLDGVPASSGVSVTQAGRHVLSVRATDAMGLSSLVTRGFSVDVSPPVVTFTGVMESQILHASAVTIGWTISDDSALTVVQVSCDLQMSTDATGSMVVSGNGVHYFSVRAVDAAGRETFKSIQFFLDSTPPVVSVFRNEGSLVPLEPDYASRAPLFIVWYGEDLSAFTSEAWLDGVPVAPTGFVYVTGEGWHTLRFLVTDVGGLSTTVIRRIRIDLNPPVVSVSGVPALTRDATITPVFSATDDGPGEVVLAAYLDGVIEVQSGQPLAVTEGHHLLTVTAWDEALNPTTETIAFDVDRTPPAISFMGAGQGEVRQTGFTPTYVVVDAHPGLSNAVLDGEPFENGASVTEEGAHILWVHAEDALGNVAPTGALSFVVDRTPPVVTRVSPQDGDHVTTDDVEVVLQVEDNLTAVTVKAGATEFLQGTDGSYRATLALAVGQNLLQVTATDQGGNVTTHPVIVHRDGDEPDAGTQDAGVDAGTPDAGADAGTPDAGVDAGTPPRDAGSGSTTDAGSIPGTDAGPVANRDAGSEPNDPAPMLVVEAPTDQDVFGDKPFVVSGRVEGGKLPLKVTVAGTSLPVNGRDFTGALTLEGEGERRLQFEVTDALGRTATAQRTVVLDRSAPVIVFTNPPGNPSSAVVASSPYQLRGTVYEPHLVRLTVDGTPAQLVADEFSFPITLDDAPDAGTLVRVVAQDLLGHTTTRDLELKALNSWPRVHIETPLNGSEAADKSIPVRVRVTSSRDLEKVLIGTALATPTPGDPSLYETTMGLAFGENTITAVATDVDGLSGSHSIVVNYRDPASEPLAVSGISPQPGAVEVEPNALVSVSFNKPINPATLDQHFTVTVEGGSAALAGGFSVAPGEQTVSFIADEPLPVGTRLRVRVADVVPAQHPDAGMVGSFHSDFQIRKPLTRVRGTVTDTDFRPLSGVRVTLEDVDRSVVTGSDGNWTLFAPRGGAMVVRFEGGLTSDGRTLPSLRRRLVVTEGGDTVDATLPLTPVDLSSAQGVDALVATTLTFADRHPGLSVDVAPRSLSFADGRTHGVVTATQVPLHAVPLPLEGRAALAGLWQLGPAGLRLNTAVTVRLPNLTDMKEGSWALLLAHDPRRHVLERVGFGRVVGKTIVSTQDLQLPSLELLGYMPLTEAQGDAVALALGMVSPTDGGTGMRTDPDSRLGPTPTLKQLLELFAPGKAYAQLGGVYYGGYSALDTLLNNTVPGAVTGQVRAPLERQLALELRKPESTALGTTRQVALPYALPLDLSARFESADPYDVTNPESVQLFVTATGPSGEVLTPLEGESWLSQGEGEAALTPHIPVPVGGTTQLTLTAQSRTNVRVMKLEAELQPDGDAGVPGEDGGMVPAARLTLRKTQDTFNEADDEAVHSPVRFKGLRVTVTGPESGLAGVTGDTGGYGIPVVSLGGESMGISCTEVPTGPRLVERLGFDGVVHYEPTINQYPVCSQTYTVSPGRSTRADILVDVRMLYGSLTFVDRHGQPLEGTCSEEQSPLDEDAGSGEYLRIAAKDVASTEVHFFREDDLSIPIATFTTGKPNGPACDASTGQLEPNQPHGSYARVRTGPAANIRRVARERCRELERADGGLSDADQGYYQANCVDNRTNYLRLNPGERLVVFAVNHATGYAGMSSVTVPTVNRIDRLPDGRCALDDGQEPLKVNEYGQELTLSRCTRAELGIPADVKLFPPELDVRVARRAEAEGLPVAQRASLIRHGGAATTRDDFVQVSTHWRVRQVGEPVTDAGTEPPPVESPADGGFDEAAWCADAGLLPDAGSCAPGIIQDRGTPGVALEVFCSELPEGATQRAQGLCAQGTPRVVDVPAGVPPLAGRLVRVTGTAVEVPAVVIFPVKPGRHTATVQTALTYLDDSGRKVTVSSLPKANYYLHVVGYPVLAHDTNQNDLLDPSEQDPKPPDFVDETRDDGGVGPSLAVSLKNIYRARESDGTAMERYDRAREHEFRVLALGTGQVMASTGDTLSDGGTAWRVLDGSTPGATDDDLAYDFLLSQVTEPDAAQRADVPVGDYTLRLGTDDYGIECPVHLDKEKKQISGTCAGEYLAEVLSAADILYFELFLSGNADNVLYRFNFYGIAPRTDYVTASSRDTLEKSLAAPVSGGSGPAGTPVVAETDRPISQKAIVYFAVDPDDVPATVRICEGQDCTGTKLLKRAKLKKQGGSLPFEITDEEGRAGRLVELAKPGANGARRFSLTLPNDLGSMQDAARKGNALLLKVQPDPSFFGLFNRDERVTALGEPLGRYALVNAFAAGQTKVQGVNLAGGHLALSHEDFSIPQFGEQVRFVRTFNNQSSVVTPQGLGWTHNYEGFVFEEEVGRYTVVLGGQSYDFPKCGLVSVEQRTATNCLPDKTHGGSLSAGLSTAPDGTPAVEFTTRDGMVYLFERLSTVSGEDGRRRWMLTRYSEGHGDPANPQEGWTHILYAGDSDRVERVERRPGNLVVVFTYEAILPEQSLKQPPDFTVSRFAERLRLKARTEDLQLLSMVGIFFRQDALEDPLALDKTKALYRVEFKHDAQGNLLRAERPTGFPRQAWAYTYAPPPAGTTGYARWRLTNELTTARYQLTAHPIPVPSPGAVLPFFDQWVATYERSGNSKTYAHVDPAEIVDSVVTSGLGPAALTISYDSEFQREVVRPDGVPITYVLNGYGSVERQTVLGLPEQVTDWMSTQISPDKVTLSNKAVLDYAVDPAHRLERVTLEALPQEGALATAGIQPNTPLVDQQYTGTASQTFGVPSVRTTPGKNGTRSVHTTLTSQGDLERVTVYGAGNEKVYETGDRKYDSEGKGVLESEVDALQQNIVYSDPSALGLPQIVELTHPNPSGKALAKVTRRLGYDRVGNVISSHDDETGADEEWEYDSLRRLLRHKIKGTPDQEWHYSYEPGDRSVTYGEALAGVDHLRTVKSQEVLIGSEAGLHVTETLRYGPRVDEHWSEAVRTTTFRNGRQESSTDALGVKRSYAYDTSGRMTGVTVTDPGSTSGPVAGTEEVRYEELDSNGNPRRVIDQNGLVTQLWYDYFGRPVRWDYTGTTSTAVPRETEEVQRDFTGAVVSRSFGGLAIPHVLNLTPDALGRTRVSQSAGSPGGVHDTYLYDAMGRVVDHYDIITGTTETFAYDDVLGRLTSYTRTTLAGPGSTAQFLEEEHEYQDTPTAGRRKVIITRRISSPTVSGGRQERFEQEVDLAGKVMKSIDLVDGVQAVTQYTYDARGSVKTITTPLGEVTTFTYDTAGNLLKKEEPGDASAPAAVTEFEVNGEGRVVLRKGPRTADKWTYGYDAFGQLTSRTLVGTNSNETWSYAYGLQGSPGSDGTVPDRAARETDPLGHEVYRFFNAHQQLLKEVREEGAATGNVLTQVYAYDGPWLRKVVTTESTTGGGATGTPWKSTVERQEIDDRGRTLKAREHWEQGTQSYEYVTLSPWNGRSVDVEQKGTTSTATVRDQLFTLELDGLGNTVKRTQAGLVDAWEFDADGNMVSATPAGGPKTTYAYEQGRLTSSSLGSEETGLTYRLDGLVSKVTQPTGRAVDFGYAARGLLKSEKYGSGSEITETTYTYDAGGYLASRTVGAGTSDAKQWLYDHGPMGELLTVTMPGQGIFTYGYDALRQLKSIREPGATLAVESFEYDYLGRQKSRTRGGSKWNTAWTQGVATLTGPGGVEADTVVSVQDGRGRTASRLFQPGTLTLGQQDLIQVTYAFDGQDGLVRAREQRNSGEVVNTFEFDGRHRLTKVSRGNDAVSYAYWADRDLVKRQASRRGSEPERAMEFDYDTLSRPKEIRTYDDDEDPTLRSTRGISFEAGGERLSRIEDDGTLGHTSERYCYDGRGWLTSIRGTLRTDTVDCGQSSAMPPVTLFEYEYDGRGNRLTESFRGNATGSVTVATAYGYDGADRLTGVRYPDTRGVLYRLAPDGLRLGEKRVNSLAMGVPLNEQGYDLVASPQTDWEYRYDAAGVLKRIEDPQGLVTEFTTDKSGRVTSETPQGGAATTYAWDAAGRLAQVSMPTPVAGGGTGTKTVKYRYGFDGLRRSRQVGTDTPTEYLWGAEGLAEERTGTTRLFYEQLGGLTVSAGGERILHDGLGSTAARMTSGGLESFRYDAWGGYQGTDKPESGEPSTGFTGHSFDADTDLVYAQQRWYSPSQGRFLSMDPASGDPSEPGSMQPWLYANGNPTGRVDPDGTTAVMAGGYCPESPGGRCPFSTRMSLMADDIGTGAGMAYDGYKGAVGRAGHGVESAGDTVGDWGLWLGTDWDGNVSPAGYTTGFIASTAVKFVGGIPVGIFGIGLLPEWAAGSFSEYQSGNRQFMRGVEQGQLDTAALGVGRMSGVVGGWAGIAAGGLRRGPSVEILPPEAGFRRSLPPGQRALRPSEMVIEGTVIRQSIGPSAGGQRVLPAGEGTFSSARQASSRTVPLDDPLIDNNILAHFMKGDVEAIAFMDRYRGLLSIDRTVAREFIRPTLIGMSGRSPLELKRLMNEYGIQLLQTASEAEARAVMDAAKQKKLVNDHYIVATAKKYGIRFATGDTRALRSAIISGVDVKYFNFHETQKTSFDFRYKSTIDMLKSEKFDVSRYIGPLDPW
ncbi:hypothetical protein D7Y13_17030 [Corallococcus praedator]|uniref:SbsA Ig-like domain-containing protein n=1 Tax=Corallococcus praedator TaxID=2316724 RepID=A0ABX9QI00_9BACT|nr:hypothetical protein D7X75_02860 [Corallococcus sp. CA031C]RKI07882.1 hypothetical protein D7Y13_17030 [Corallococcus praedator]